jgi:hypothetical protein
MCYRPRLERLEDRTVPSFFNAGSYPAGWEPTSVAVGDFRGNGIQDLAVAAYLDNSVNVLLGNGDGSFQSPIKYPVDPDPSVVVVSDLRGNGIQDLLVGVTGADKLSVLLGNGDGTFQTPVSYSVDFIRSMTVADFDGDGTPDVAVTNFSQVVILLGNGDGSFRQGATYALAVGINGLTACDLRGDGVQDLAVTYGFGSGSVKVLLGNGDGTFEAPVSYGTNGYAQSVAAADFNGDGIPDLAVANDEGPGTGKPGTVSILLGNGDGTFQQRIDFPAGDYPNTVVSGDWNGDGVPDLAVSNDLGGYAQDTVTILLGQGDGTFSAPESYDVGQRPGDLAVGDFDGDGSPDLVTADYFGGTVTVLLNGNDWNTGPPVLARLSYPAQQSAAEPPVSLGSLVTETLPRSPQAQTATDSMACGLVDDAPIPGFLSTASFVSLRVHRMPATPAVATDGLADDPVGGDPHDSDGDRSAIVSK